MSKGWHKSLPESVVDQTSIQRPASNARMASTQLYLAVAEKRCNSLPNVLFGAFYKCVSQDICEQNLQAWTLVGGHGPAFNAYRVLQLRRILLRVQGV